MISINTLLLIICVVSIGIVFMTLRKISRQIDDSLLVIAQLQSEWEQFRQELINTENFKIGSHKYTLVAMRLYVENVKNRAVAEERYEDAQRCQQAINEMTKLINA